MTITGVHALNGFIRLIGTHLRRYAPPVGDAVGPPTIRAPYEATPGGLGYHLQPNGWVSVQLGYQIQDPCIRWSQTVYDRTVEVTYTQGDRVVHIQEVPLVPLNITPRHSCRRTA